MFDKNTTLKEALGKKGAGEILARHNVPCLGCAYAKTEMEFLKLGDIAQTYGIDLDKLLKDLNALGKGKR